MRMSTWRTVVSWGARVLCVVFLPVVLIITSQGTAQAAVAVSDGVPAEWGFDDFIPGQWANCTTTVYYRVDEPTSGPIAQQVKSVNGDCSTGTGWDLEAVEFWASGVTSTGAGCEFPRTGGTVGADDAFAFTLTRGAATIADMCQVTEICMYGADESPWGDESFTDCEPVGMGVPPDPGPGLTGSCINGNVTSVGIEHDRQNQRVRVHLTWLGSVQNPAALFQVRLYAAAQTALIPANGYAGADLDVEAGSSPTEWMNWPWAEHTGGAVSILPRNFTVTPENPAGSQALLQGPAHLGPPDGPKGYTNRDMCTVWYGPKIYNDPASTFDEPAGQPGEEPAGEEPPAPDPVNEPPIGKEDCTFTLSDPSTWLEGGMCAAVGLLGRLVGLLGQAVSLLASLPGAIVSALGNFLELAFVPSNEKVSDFKDATAGEFEESNATAWTDEIQGLFGGGTAAGSTFTAPRTTVGGAGLEFSGGCQGPALTWEGFGNRPGGDTTLHPLNACSGITQDLAHWATVVIEVFTSVLGAIKILEILLQSLGLVKQIRVLNNFDWSAAQRRV